MNIENYETKFYFNPDTFHIVIGYVKYQVKSNQIQKKIVGIFKR